jgi:protein arginine N-methyltransferase 1
MSVLKEAVITEPLVDNVEAAAICTEVALVHRIDLETVARGDTCFVSGFRLKATRKDTVHALVAWFEVEFGHGTKPIVLSTSPRLRTTHWKHTVFYTDQPIPLFENDTLTGNIAVRKNLAHARELDIKISFHCDNQYPTHLMRFYRLK